MVLIGWLNVTLSIVLGVLLVIDGNIAAAAGWASSACGWMAALSNDLL